MKNKIIILLIIWLAQMPFAEAQSSSHYYYQTYKLAPSHIYFRPNSRDMTCASFLNPSGNSGVSLDVSGLLKQFSCPAKPPLVVWGENQRGSRKIYAINTIRVRFYGPGRYDGPSGITTLLQVIKNNYYIRILADGDLGLAEVQYLPPVRQPTINSPMADSPAWRSWRGEERIEIDTPQITKKRNLGRGNRTCRRLYGDRCWLADFVWALPVRLVIKGDEAGSPIINVALPKHPDAAFVNKTSGRSASLSVRDGSLVNIFLEPANFEEP